jgi:hypothetical protein
VNAGPLPQAWSEDEQDASGWQGSAGGDCAHAGTPPATAARTRKIADLQLPAKGKPYPKKRPKSCEKSAADYAQTSPQRQYRF